MYTGLPEWNLTRIELPAKKHNGAPEWNFKCTSSDMCCKRGPNKKRCSIFKLLYLIQT